MWKRAFADLPKPGLLCWLGIVLLGMSTLLALFGPLLAPYSVGEIVTRVPYSSSGDGLSFLGGDGLGRDVLSRLLHGAPYTLGIALISTVLSFLLGVGLGFVAAEKRGLTDEIITWLIDVLLSIPPLLLALLVIFALGSSTPVLIAAIAFVKAPRIARVARSVALGISTLEFVEVARAQGESLLSRLWREILPNSVRPLMVEFGLRLTYAVFFLSTLSFLGLGIQPPEADWGSLVRENISGVLLGSYAAIYPAIAIGALGVGINLVVDWIGGKSSRELSVELK